MTLGVVKGLVGPLYSPKVLYFHFICRKPAFRHPIPKISRIDFQNRVLEVQPAFLREMVDLGIYVMNSRHRVLTNYWTQVWMIKNIAVSCHKGERKSQSLIDEKLVVSLSLPSELCQPFFKVCKTSSPATK